MRVIIVLLALSAIACEGPMGPPGPQGPRGEMGERGEPGENGLDVAQTVYCAGDVYVDGALFLALGYMAVEYTNGAVEVWCSVANGFTESRGGTYYDAEQQGAVDHRCLVATDETGGFGYWFFARDAQGYLAEYMATGSPNDGFIVEFDGADPLSGGCTTFMP